MPTARVRYPAPIALPPSLSITTSRNLIPLLPPTLNPGSSPASPAVSTPPYVVPSSPSLPGLPASPRKKLLYDTLKKPSMIRIPTSEFGFRCSGSQPCPILIASMLSSQVHPLVCPAPASNKQRAPKTKEQEEEDAKRRLLLRHHVFISSLTPEGLPLLKQLKGPATKQVRLLFGDADSLDPLEFDEAQANYVRCLPSEEHHRAWDGAQTHTEGGLVLLSSSLSA
ncbi:uncharacterized protein UHOD_11072 [Ustilago sp. UG-2017b]|nr:uncharacterized protein UHOD_11072 [Ustilago sp. UG-2017b]